MWAGSALPSAAQGPSPATPTARAVRLPAEATIDLDGRLDESVWSSVTPVTGLVLREPTEGDPAPEATRVHFLYTNDALYVGARMESAEAAELRAIVARRDRDTPSEELVISFDPRSDRTTAYTFTVTPGGVRTDYFHARDRDSGDRSYDPVWEVRTSIDPEGWSAEMRIPFSQLRYNAEASQTWGLNVVRRIPRRNEEAYWRLIPRDDTGWSSRMGLLTGLDGIDAGQRIEVLPYIATGATRTSDVDPADPFVERTAGEMRAGADLKLGLGPSMTLDATINPDFGQVEADPAVVNLSAFEVFFGERRPFFVERADLFGGRGNFYSRRIGASPPVQPQSPFYEELDNTTILGAAKLTGRLPSGLSVGALGAVTAEETVRTYDPDGDVFGRAVVSPRTSYGVVSLRQELGENRSTLGLVLTGVDRALEAGGALSQVLVDRAYSGLVDGRWRWNQGRYDMSAYLGFSHVAGDSAALLRLQTSSRRFFQRPDADHVSVDPSLTRMSGVNAGINHSKLAGDWRWDVDYFYESPGLELNDIGRLGATDAHGAIANLTYRESEPGDLFHRWYAGVFSIHEWNDGGIRKDGQISLYGGVTWKNFWGVELGLDFEPRALSDNLTRGGPLMRTPRSWDLSLEVSNNPGSRTQWEVNVDGGQDELDGWFAATRGTLSFRPGPRWELSLNPGYLRRVVPRQYVTRRGGGSAATFGERYVFARLDRSEIVARIRANYALRPDLTLEGYFEPFASSGRFDRLGELRAARTFDLRTYGTDGTTLAPNADGYEVRDGTETFGLPDRSFDVRSFRSNVVLRWEWRPGSTLFLVWQQDRFERTLPSGTVGPSTLFDAVSVPGDHFIAFKVSYWLPVG